MPATDRIAAPRTTQGEPAQRAAGTSHDAGIDASPAMLAQRKQIANAFGQAAQLASPDEELQKKSPEEELQKKAPEEELRKGA